MQVEPNVDPYAVFDWSTLEKLGKDIGTEIKKWDGNIWNGNTWDGNAWDKKYSLNSFLR